MSITIEKTGRRHYLRGNTYPIKDALRAAGCKWDPEAKAWWTGQAEVAERIVSGQRSDEAVEQARPTDARPEPQAPGLDATVAGRVEYKGKTYYLAGRVARGRTHYDDQVAGVESRDGSRMLLYFRDGSRQFWAAAAAITVKKRYSRPTTIARLREYADRARQAEANGHGGALEDGYYYGPGGEVLASGCGECSRLGTMCRSCEHDYS